MACRRNDRLSTISTNLLLLFSGLLTTEAATASDPSRIEQTLAATQSLVPTASTDAAMPAASVFSIPSVSSLRL